MGKLFDDYMAAYHEAVDAGMKAAGTTDGYTVLPEVWIAAKWSRENNLHPWQPEFIPAVSKVFDEDPTLATAIAKGTRLIAQCAANPEG